MAKKDSVYRFTVNGGADNQAVVNTFCWCLQDSGDPDRDENIPAAVLTDLHDEMYTRYRTNLIPLLPPQYSVMTYQTVELLNYTWVNGKTVGNAHYGDQRLKVAVPASDTGTRANEDGADAVLPTFVVLNVQRNVSIAGRHYRSRYAFSPIMDIDTRQNTIVGGLSGSVKTALNAMIANRSVTVGGVEYIWTPCVHSPTYNSQQAHSGENASAFVATVLDFQPRTRPGSQLSRKHKNVFQ